MIRRGDASFASGLSASAFRRLVEDAAPLLADGGVHAVFASTVGSRRSPGPTWISVSSAQAYGRIMRRGDGSFVSAAYRTPDGAQVCAAAGAHVQREDFETLIAAVAPARQTQVVRHT
jgi:hypothetical protein